MLYIRCQFRTVFESELYALKKAPVKHEVYPLQASARVAHDISFFYIAHTDISAWRCHESVYGLAIKYASPYHKVNIRPYELFLKPLLWLDYLSRSCHYKISFDTKIRTRISLIVLILRFLFHSETNINNLFVFVIIYGLLLCVLTNFRSI